MLVDRLASINAWIWSLVHEIILNKIQVNIVKLLGRRIFRKGKEKKHCLYTVKKRDEIYINHLKYYTNHLKFIFVTKLLLNCAKNTVFFL